MLLSLLLWLQLGSSLAVGGEKKEFPDPQKEWRMCGRPRPSFVCDPEFVLQLGDAEKLDQIAVEFRKSTACQCSECPDDTGVSLGIYVRPKVTNESLFQYPSGRELAEMLRRKWGLSHCDSDIIIVLLTQQNISDFSLGAAVRKVLSLSTAEQIVNDCRVHFNFGWYYQGLESIANSLNDVLVKLQKKPAPTFKNLFLGIGLGFGVLLVLTLVALCLLNRQGRKRTKSRCSDIYESVPTNNRRKSSFNQEQHLEKLSQLNPSDDEESLCSGQHYEYREPRNHLSVQFSRLHRQLSDVTEESSEDVETALRNSIHTSSFGGSSYHTVGDRSIPVTEL